MPDPAPEITTHTATIVLTNNVLVGFQTPISLLNVTFAHRYLQLGVIHGSGEGWTLEQWPPGVAESLTFNFQTGFLSPDDAWELEFTDPTGSYWTTGGWQVANCDESNAGQTINLNLEAWYYGGGDGQSAEYQAGFTLNGWNVTASLQAAP